MKRQPFIFIVLCIVVMLPNLIYSQSEEVGIGKKYDLYTIGTIGTGDFKKDTACYWKNSVRHNLSPSKSRVSALFIDGKDVYISGHYYKGYKIQPCYWKNGNFVALEAKEETYTSDILVSGKNVYVTGHQKINDRTIPCYWQNGVKKDLKILDGGSGYTKSIASNGKDIYIAGFLSTARDKIMEVEPCYWKNGKLIKLNLSPYKYSIAANICIDNKHTYIAGRLDDTEKECLCIWKDTTRIDYPAVSNKYSSGAFLTTWESADYVHFTYENGITYHKVSINSMEVSDDSIYMVGEQNNIDCYWVNGKMTRLDGNSKNISPGAITVIGKKILIAGNSDKTICVWENGVKSEIVKLNKNERAKSYGFMKK